jgi:sensor histidine kinase YesM
MENPYSKANIIKGSIISALFLLFVNFFMVRQYDYSYRISIKDSLGSLLFWTIGAAIIGNTIRYYLPIQNRIIYFGGLILLSTVIWSFGTYYLLQTINRRSSQYQEFLQLSMIFRISFTVLLFTSMAILFAFLNLLNDQYKSEKKNIELQKLARETELNNLQEKLHPHFLFNSLNSINALVAIDPDKARKMVQQLSDFLRSTLKRDNDEKISLQEELEYLSLYLEIEKVRFGHRLNTQINIDRDLLSFPIPPFILLPLVENAIKFGLYDTLDDVLISINIEAENNVLTVQITNPFDPETSGRRKGTGYGIKAVNRRLFLLFGRTDLLLTKTDNNLFATKVYIPPTI